MCPSNPALSFNLKVVKTGPDTFSWKYRELHKNSCLCQMDVFKATVEQHVGDTNATESDYAGKSKCLHRKASKFPVDTAPMMQVQNTKFSQRSCQQD